MARKTVLCFGTFDLLHLGHIHYFQQAKRYGDYLIVVIARDETKEKQKKETVFKEEERQEMVAQLRMVDEAVLGNADDHFRIIEQKKPDVICLGYDQKVEEGAVKEKLAARGLSPQIIRLKPYRPEKNKSSRIRARVLEST